MRLLLKNRPFSENLPMPQYGQLTGTDDDGTEGTWLIELADDGTPPPDHVPNPLALMPDVGPMWSIDLLIAAEHGISFSGDEAGEIALPMMRRRMAEVEGRDADRNTR
jgi:hypothetical protein